MLSFNIGNYLIKRRSERFIKKIVDQSAYFASQEYCHLYQRSVKDCSIRPLLVDCSFMVIRCIRVWQLYFTTCELLVTSQFLKMNKNKKNIFNLKTPKQSLKDTWNMWELNNKHSGKPRCPQRRNHDCYMIVWKQHGAF